MRILSVLGQQEKRLFYMEKEYMEKSNYMEKIRVLKTKIV